MGLVASKAGVGWIDSKIHSLDDTRYEQYFTPRKPASPWSKVNKDKIEQLERDGRIRPAGRAAIDIAMENGSWTLLDGAQAGILPDDLATDLAERDATERFRALSPSRQRNILQWIALAKRPDTRQRRITATADAAAQNAAPPNF